MATAFFLLGSPGPVPVALAASGATFGFKNSFKFLMGILFGIAVVIFATFLGLAAILENNPELTVVLQVVSALYITYIAYKIASLSSSQATPDNEVPGFKVGFILNLINPKAYAAMLALIAQFSLISDNTSTNLLLACAVIFTVVVVVDTAWLLLGSLIEPIFNHPKHQKRLRYFFALSLVAIAIYSLIRMFI